MIIITLMLLKYLKHTPNNVFYEVYMSVSVFYNMMTPSKYLCFRFTSVSKFQCDRNSDIPLEALGPSVQGCVWCVCDKPSWEPWDLSHQIQCTGRTDLVHKNVTNHIWNMGSEGQSSIWFLCISVNGLYLICQIIPFSCWSVLQIRQWMNHHSTYRHTQITKQHKDK